MLAKIHTAATVGLEVTPIEVEVDIQRRAMRNFTIVGLGDRAVDEARERVRAAITNAGIQFPGGRITVNLAPADTKKTGPLFDLAIALGILIAAGEVPKTDFKDALFIGELALDGKVRHVNGVLPIVIFAREKKIKRVFAPAVDAGEASLISDVEICPVGTLDDLIRHFRDGVDLPQTQKIDAAKLHASADYGLDMATVKGHEHVKRALEIAAAGAHNVLMSGPPGSGKTLLARTFRTILPRMELDEALETTKIYSVAGMLPSDEPLVRLRPFRAPHHTASAVALVGGGRVPKPGEISLAHRGILFLDEFAEFPSQVLEVLRQPLEDHVVTIARASGTLTFPSRFLLIAAMNPCPCGFFRAMIPGKECRCNPGQIANYRKRISGPMLDRIDLYVDVPHVPFEKLSSTSPGENSTEIAKRVQIARDRATVRYAKFPHITTNADIGPKEIEKFCEVDPESTDLLRSAITTMNLSNRAYHRILKLARTIADLDGDEKIGVHQVAEALQYRPKLGES